MNIHFPVNTNTGKSASGFTYGERGMDGPAINKGLKELRKMDKQRAIMRKNTALATK